MRRVDKSVMGVPVGLRAGLAGCGGCGAGWAHLLVVLEEGERVKALVARCAGEAGLGIRSVCRLQKWVDTDLVVELML